MDVTEDDSVRSAFERAVSLFGTVDVLVNNAGIAIDGPERRASTPDLSKVRVTLETNLFGAWRCAAEAVPLMRHAGLAGHAARRRADRRLLFYERELLVW